MRTVIVVVLAGLVVGACGDSTGPEPQPSTHAGVYDMVGVMGESLPGTMSTGIDAWYVATSAVLHLRTSGTWTDTIQYERHFDNGSVQNVQPRMMTISGIWTAGHDGTPTVMLVPEGDERFKTALCAAEGGQLSCDVLAGFIPDIATVYERR